MVEDKSNDIKEIKKPIHAYVDEFKLEFVSLINKYSNEVPIWLLDITVENMAHDLRDVSNQQKNDDLKAYYDMISESKKEEENV